MARYIPDMEIITNKKSKSMKDQNIQWVKSNVLARSCRPGYYMEHGDMQQEVNEWLDVVKSLGIKSIICLLSRPELDEYYGKKGIDLLQCYEARGLEVHNIRIKDYKEPPLTSLELHRIMDAFVCMTKPVLIHCSAGMDRTGMAVNNLKKHLG